jgi:hypothetical protein
MGAFMYSRMGNEERACSGVRQKQRERPGTWIQEKKSIKRRAVNQTNPGYYVLEMETCKGERQGGRRATERYSRHVHPPAVDSVP